jgi:hypothetical protein
MNGRRKALRDGQKTAKFKKFHVRRVAHFYRNELHENANE